MKKTKKQEGLNEASKGARASAISLSLVLGFLLLALFTNQEVEVQFLLALAELSLMACIFLLFLAMRKFGNNEFKAGSEIVRNANFAGTAGYGFVVLATGIILWKSEPLFAGMFLAFAALTFSWLFKFGKKRMYYW